MRRNTDEFVEVPFLPGYLIGVGASQFELLSDFKGGRLAILKSDCVASVKFSDEIMEIVPPWPRHPRFREEPFGGKVSETVTQAVGRCVDRGEYSTDYISSGIVSYSLAEPCQFIVDMEILELVVTTKSAKTYLFVAFDTMFVWSADPPP